MLGETGRIIMGLVIISGTGAAVNALFAAVGGMIAEVSRQAVLPIFIQRRALERLRQEINEESATNGGSLDEEQ